MQLQAHSAQHNVKNNQDLSSLKILKTLWHEGGFKGLYKGWNANIPRLFIGSSVQLTTFGLITDRLKHLDVRYAVVKLLIIKIKNFALL